MFVIYVDDLPLAVVTNWGYANNYKRELDRYFSKEAELNKGNLDYKKPIIRLKQVPVLQPGDDLIDILGLPKLNNTRY